MTTFVEINDEGGAIRAGERLSDLASQMTAADVPPDSESIEWGDDEFGEYMRNEYNKIVDGPETSGPLPDQCVEMRSRLAERYQTLGEGVVKAINDASLQELANFAEFQDDDVAPTVQTGGGGGTGGGGSGSAGGTGGGGTGGGGSGSGGGTGGGGNGDDSGSGDITAGGAGGSGSGSDAAPAVVTGTVSASVLTYDQTDDAATTDDSTTNDDGHTAAEADRAAEADGAVDDSHPDGDDRHSDEEQPVRGSRTSAPFLRTTDDPVAAVDGPPEGGLSLPENSSPVDSSARSEDGQPADDSTPGADRALFYSRLSPLESRMSPLEGIPVTASHESAPQTGDQESGQEVGGDRDAIYARRTFAIVEDDQARDVG